MKFIQIGLLVLFALFLWSVMFGLIYLGNTIAGNAGKVYNCSIAEISPDFTPKMRQECRRLNSQTYNK